MTKFFIGVGLFIVLLTVGFVLTGYDYANYKFWAPKYENARRQVFENTQSYVEGKVGYLTQLRYQYETDPRPELKILILTEASTIDNNKLPLDMQAFIYSLKGELK